MFDKEYYIRGERKGRVIPYLIRSIRSEEKGRVVIPCLIRSIISEEKGRVELSYV